MPTLLVGLLDTADSGVGTVISANGMWTGAPMCRPDERLCNNVAGLNDVPSGRQASRDAESMPPPLLNCPWNTHFACPGKATCNKPMPLVRAYCSNFDQGHNAHQWNNECCRLSHLTIHPAHQHVHLKIVSIYTSSQCDLKCCSQTLLYVNIAVKGHTVLNTLADTE